jgi:hypothetical protein
MLPAVVALRTASSDCLVMLPVGCFGLRPQTNDHSTTPHWENDGIEVMIRDLSAYPALTCGDC